MSDERFRVVYWDKSFKPDWTRFIGINIVPKQQLDILML